MVINTLASTDWSEGFVWGVSWILASLQKMLFYSKCVKFADYWWFSRCRKRERKTDYRRDNGYIDVGTVSSVVKLTWPGIADRPNDVAFSIDWSSYQFKTFQHLWRRLWSCGHELRLKLKIGEVIWMLVMTNWSKPGLDVIVVLWTQGLLTTFHFHKVICHLVKTV